MMRKIWTIARREYTAMVATKAFLISIAFMPLLMAGSIFLASKAGNLGDVADKRIIVADGTHGELFKDLAAAAKVRNAMLSAMQGEGAKPQASGAAAAKYVIERHASDSLGDDDRLKLSDQVRRGEIKAFVEIPAGLDLGDGSAPSGAPGSGGPSGEVRFYSSDAIFSMERSWLEQALGDAVKTRRLAALKLDPDSVRRATAAIPIAARGLVKKQVDGKIHGADEERSAAMMFMPFGFMMLMFMVIMLSAQPLLESAIEEKSGRIAEVLLGSVSTFELMMGKLLGNVAGSLSAVLIYGLGGYIVASYKGWTDLVPWHLVPWFIVFQVLAVLLFSSLFLATGAAVTQLKEAQSLLLPIWLLMSIPMFVWLQIVREPNGPIATGLSFFPPAAPLVMAMRLSSEEVIPAWQIAASLVLLVATTAAVVFLAGRVFRVGILWQGKSPKLRELVRWAFTG